MPLLVAALIGGLIQAAFSMVGRVLIALGFSIITWTALDTSLEWVKAQIAASMSGLPAQALDVLGACRLGSAVAVVLSAIAARMLFDGMTGGAVKRMVLK
jgi:hypothetical protein